MIPLFKVKMSENAITKVSDVLRSGYIGQGSQVEEFEKNLKIWFNNDYILTMNSATSAEHLAIYMLKNKKNEWPGIEIGDEILATPLTCTASNFPIITNGFNIKWVDVDSNTLNMDLDDLARKITNKTKAIMLVHWGGYPVDLDEVKDIQERAKSIIGFKPAVIEDCAHAIGSTYKDKKLGSHGNFCTFSFQAIKHMTSVDGGILVCPHQDLYRRGKLLRWYGIDRETNRKDFRCEGDIEEIGFKFHMNDVCAAIGNENLKELNNTIEIHQNNASFYDKSLNDFNGISLLERAKDRTSSFWLYTMLVDRRDDFMEKMKSDGIMVSRVHERNDKHTCVKQFRSQLPNLEKIIDKMICIPVGWWVSPEERQYIVNKIKEGW